MYIYVLCLIIYRTVFCKLCWKYHFLYLPIFLSSSIHHPWPGVRVATHEALAPCSAHIWAARHGNDTKDGREKKNVKEKEINEIDDWFDVLRKKEIQFHHFFLYKEDKSWELWSFCCEDGQNFWGCFSRLEVCLLRLRLSRRHGRHELISSSWNFDKNDLNDKWPLLQRWKLCSSKAFTVLLLNVGNSKARQIYAPQIIQNHGDTSTLPSTLQDPPMGINDSEDFFLWRDTCGDMNKVDFLHLLSKFFPLTSDFSLLKTETCTHWSA